MLLNMITASLLLQVAAMTRGSKRSQPEISRAVVLISIVAPEGFIEGEHLLLPGTWAKHSGTDSNNTSRSRSTDGSTQARADCCYKYTLRLADKLLS